MSKLNDEQRAEIRERATRESRRALGRAYGVSHVTITKIVQGRPSRKRMLEHEVSALRRLLAEISAGPELDKRYSQLDVQTCAMALSRITGVDALGAP